MKRILYLDSKSNEIENILTGKKNMIIRAANIKKYPYQFIDKGDTLYFMNTTSDSIIYASATCSDALYINETNKEKRQILIKSLKDKLLLRESKLQYVVERKYISIFTLSNIKKEYAYLDRSLYGIEEDWIRLETVKD